VQHSTLQQSAICSNNTILRLKAIENNLIIQLASGDISFWRIDEFSLQIRKECFVYQSDNKKLLDFAFIV
jgi:hypothetical protein